MLPYQQRVCDELEDLSTKIRALILFIDTEPFKALDTIDQSLLLDQLEAMQNYQSILDKRIARFKVM